MGEIDSSDICGYFQILTAYSESATSLYPTNVQSEFDESNRNIISQTDGSSQLSQQGRDCEKADVIIQYPKTFGVFIRWRHLPDSAIHAHGTLVRHRLCYFANVIHVYFHSTGAWGVRGPWLARCGVFASPLHIDGLVAGGNAHLLSTARTCFVFLLSLDMCWGTERGARAVGSCDSSTVWLPTLIVPLLGTTRIGLRSACPLVGYVAVKHTVIACVRVVCAESFPTCPVLSLNQK